MVKKALKLYPKICRKEQLKPINELIKRFSNTYEFCNGDINKFIFILRKGVYPYEYINGSIWI